MTFETFETKSVAFAQPGSGETGSANAMQTIKKESDVMIIVNNAYQMIK